MKLDTDGRKRPPLKDVVPVMGDMGHDIYVAWEDDYRSRTATTIGMLEKQAMRTADALLRFGDHLVVHVRPYICTDGEYRGNIYVLHEETEAPHRFYVANTEHIPYDVPTWRLGDTAYVIEPGSCRPKECRVTACCNTRGKDPTFCLKCANSDETLYDVPLVALFKSPESAIAHDRGLVPAP